NLSIENLNWKYFGIPEHIVNNETHPHDIGICEILKEEAKEKHDIQLIRYSKGVPIWEEIGYWIDEFDETLDAYFEWQEEQVRFFYTFFKDSYLSGIYYDLEGYDNYAILLTQDLIHLYKKSPEKCIARFFKLLYPLYLFYPRTREFMKDELIISVNTDGTSPSNKDVDLVTLVKLVESFPTLEEDYDRWSFIQRNCRALNLTYNEYVILEFISYRVSGFWGPFQPDEENQMFAKWLNFFRWVIKELAEKTDSQGRPYTYKLRQMAKRFSFKRTKLYKNFISSAKHCEVVPDVYNLYELYLAIYLYSEAVVGVEIYNPLYEDTILCTIFEDEENEVYKKVLKKSLFPLIHKVVKAMLKEYPLFTKEERMNIYASDPEKMWFDYYEFKEKYGNNISKLRTKVEYLLKLNPHHPKRQDLYFELACVEGRKDNANIELVLELYLKYLELSYENNYWDVETLTPFYCSGMFPGIEQRREYKYMIALYKEERDLKQLQIRLKKLVAGHLQYPFLHKKKKNRIVLRERLNFYILILTLACYENLIVYLISFL
ncbi:MAG: hypothetical protein LUH10_14980, partial [Tannerellaceae bacterium]|nr:hypothetical protein [Tannerellaceae bacterium]